jgi:hypothetical protein
MKVKLCGVLEYDEEWLHGDDPESYEWFMRDVLFGSNLSILDSDVGDTIGTFTVQILEELDDENDS